MLEAVAVLSQQLVPVLLMDGKIKEAIDASLDACTATAATMVMRNRGMPGLRTGIQAQEILEEKPNEHWDTAENWSAAFGVVPAVMHIGRLITRDCETGRRLARELIDACGEVAETASCPSLWIESADFVKWIFINPLSASELHDKANEASAKSNYALQRLGYLGCTLVPDASVDEAPIYHGIVLHHLYKTMGHRAPVYQKVAIPFLADYWQATFAQQRFRFAAPQAVDAELKAALTRSADVIAQAILNIVICGLGVRYPIAADEVKKWLAGT
jgi:hypothetical protein